MASKKFITLVVLFILMLLFASSKVESRILGVWKPPFPPQDNPGCITDCVKHR